MYTLLDQDEFWEPAVGGPVRLEDMAPRHKRNTLALLERRARSLRCAYDMTTVQYLLGPLGPSGDAACDAVDAALEAEWAMGDLEWLHSRKLVKRLVVLIAIDQLTSAPDEPPPTRQQLRKYYVAIGKSDAEIEKIIGADQEE